MWMPSDWRPFASDPLAKQPWLWILYFGGWLLALLAPADVLERSSFLRELCGEFGRIVPSIAAWSAYSAFPQPTALFFSYAWAASLAQGIIVARHLPSQERFVRVWRDSRVKVFRAALFFPFVIALAFIATHFAVNDSPPCVVCVNQSRIGMAMLGGLITFGTAGLIAAVYWWFRNFKLIYLTERS